MKMIDVLPALDASVFEESRKASLREVIRGQVRNFKLLMSTNEQYVKSPLTYNAVLSLLSQIEYLAPAAFESPEYNILNSIPDPNTHIMRHVK